MEVVASLSQGRTAAAQCVLFTHKSVPVIFEPPCTIQKPRGLKCSHLWILPKLSVVIRVWWWGGEDTSSKLIFIFTSTVESGVVYSSEKWVFTDKTIRCEGPEDRNMNFIASKQGCVFPSPTPVAVVSQRLETKTEKGENQNQYLTNGAGTDMWLLADSVTLRAQYIKSAIYELIWKQELQEAYISLQVKCHVKCIARLSTA